MRNDWISEAIIQEWVMALIGIAITPRFGRIKSKKRKQDIANISDRALRVTVNELGLKSQVQRSEKFSISSAKNSAGVFHPNVFRGLPLSDLEMSLSCV